MPLRKCSDAYLCQIIVPVLKGFKTFFIIVVTEAGYPYAQTQAAYLRWCRDTF